MVWSFTICIWSDAGYDVVQGQLCNYSEHNSFSVTSDLLNSENLKVALARLCHDIQICNFTML